jgi:hypothetical protein
MTALELTVTVQKDGKTVQARRENGAEYMGQVDLDPLRHDIIHVFENWLAKNKIESSEELIVLGRLLYEKLFGSEIGTGFKQSFQEARAAGQRLRVQLSFQGEDAELANLPWEYLYYHGSGDRSFYLATDVDLVLSRYMPLQTGRPESLMAEQSPLCVLIVVSEPVNLGPVIPEPVIEVIQKVADRHPITVSRLDKPTIDNLLEIFEGQKSHVLHFIGHGRFNRAQKRGEIALLGPDEQSVEWMRDSVFAQMLIRSRAIPRLVFLHLCESATVDFTANFAGLAPQLIQVGVQAVVAMQYPITNQAAISFSRDFYRELAKGRPVDVAVQEGRWRITADDATAQESRTFGTPVLYMRSVSGIILPAEQAAGKESGMPGGTT